MIDKCTILKNPLILLMVLKIRASLLLAYTVDTAWFLMQSQDLPVLVLMVTLESYVK